MIDLTAKTALITGASRGIGAAAARHLAICGAHVVLAARSKAEIDAVAADINADGGRASAVACDVSQYNQVKTAVDHALALNGTLDILVNNAGVIEPIGRMTDVDPEAWGTVIDINVKGVFNGLHAALPIMEKQGAGTIVNISSGAATGAMEGWSHYCSSKAAALSLTKCADKEYRDRGIRVLGLSPGTVATEMQVVIKASGINPVSQLNLEDHIPADWPAKAIAWLCTGAADEFLGQDFSIKTDENRRLAGLIG